MLLVKGLAKVIVFIWLLRKTHSKILSINIGLKHAMGGQAISEDQEYDEKYRYAVCFKAVVFIMLRSILWQELQCSCPRTD